ncbi:MAG: DNA methyltransferase [Candidatus Binatia bacterium]
MATPPSITTAESEAVPLAVWPCAQTTARWQRTGRYVPESTRHPGKMLPELARRILTEYSQPGDIVVDPMCGIGTTLVEAAALGRRCIGVELEERWVAIARDNLRMALTSRQRSLTDVRLGDARSLATLVKGFRGRTELVVTSPPYECEAGVIDKRAWLRGRRLCDASTLNYSSDPENIGHARGAQYQSAMAAVYAQCSAVLRPGGLLVTVTKNMRNRRRLVDLASITIELARAAGFGYVQHNIALHAAVRHGELVSRPSFWQLNQTGRARQSGLALHLIAHEDVLVFMKPKVTSHE